MKQIIYTLSLIFLLGACTDEQYVDTPSSQGGVPGELVPVKLVLNTQPQQSPACSATKAGGDVLSSTQVGQYMEISLMKTPVTRALADEVQNFMVFQFEGAEPTSILVRKHFFDGSSVEAVELVQSGDAKQRIIVVANTSEETFSSLLDLDGAAAVAGPVATLSEFNDLAISYVGNETSFPQFNAGSASHVYLSGFADMVVSANKQADIMLFRGVAKVNVNLILSADMAAKGYNSWKSEFVKVPDKSFYYSTSRIAEFPGEKAGYIEGFNKGDLLLSTDTFKLGDVYLPVNLQNPIPFTTPEMRVTNAPSNATYLQITGLKVNENEVITSSVVYQIHLGNNFTDDYSVSPNLFYNYTITITGESSFDSRVVKFIPGYFGGKLTMYNSANQSTQNVNDAETWRFEQRIEVYLTDVNAPNGTAWMSEGVLPLSNDFVDGCKNTFKLIGDTDRLPAIKKCVDLNGFTTLPESEEQLVWYMPSYGQSLGIYVAGSNTLKTLPDKYYWSSTTNGGFVWGTKIWTGQNSRLGSDESHYLRCIKNLSQSDNSAIQ